MHSIRRFLAVLLIGSLIASDAMTFWHLGRCGCESACEVASSQMASGDSVAWNRSSNHGKACDLACNHAANPFAKRRAAREVADRASENAKAATKETVTANHAVATEDESAPATPSHEHDPGECSLCRWLVTTRNAWVVAAKPVLIELTLCDTAAVVDWTNPTLKPRNQELSRRGPPVSPTLS